MKTRKKLKEESENAEQRALDHFRKLQRIEDIVLRAEIDKTPAVFVVEKNKRSYSSAKLNNFKIRICINSYIFILPKRKGDVKYDRKSNDIARI